MSQKAHSLVTVRLIGHNACYVKLALFLFMVLNNAARFS